MCSIPIAARRARHTRQHLAQQARLGELWPEENRLLSFFPTFPACYSTAELQRREGTASCCCHGTQPCTTLGEKHPRVLQATPRCPSGSQTQVTNTTGPELVQVNAEPGPEGFAGRVPAASLRQPRAAPCTQPRCSLRRAVRPRTAHKSNGTYSPAKHGTRTRAESYSCCGNHNFKISDSPALKGRVRQKVTFPYNFIFFLKPHGILLCCFIEEQE